MILKNTNFEKMDKLSLAREPFFFFVDFEGENVEIFDENELDKAILSFNKRDRRYGGLNNVK